MTTIQKHKKAIETKKYNGEVTEFNGYIQFGEVRGSEHDLIGFTPEMIKTCIDCIKSPNFLYSRQKRSLACGSTD